MPARRRDRDREQKSKRLSECRLESRYVHVRSPSAAPASERALLESVPRLWIARPGRHNASEFRISYRGTHGQPCLSLNCLVG